MQYTCTAARGSNRRRHDQCVVAVLPSRQPSEPNFFISKERPYSGRFVSSRSPFLAQHNPKSHNRLLVPLLHQPPVVVTRILGEFGDLDTVAPTYTEEEAAVMLQVFSCSRSRGGSCRTTSNHPGLYHSCMRLLSPYMLKTITINADGKRELAGGARTHNSLLAKRTAMFQ